MLCSNCGKDSPFVGKVCPWCHHNKENDQLIFAMVCISAVIGVILGGLIGGLGFAIGGFFIGMILGAGFGAAANAALQQRQQQTEQQREEPEEAPHQPRRLLCPKCHAPLDREHGQTKVQCTNCNRRITVKRRVVTPDGFSARLFSIFARLYCLENWQGSHLESLSNEGRDANDF